MENYHPGNGIQGQERVGLKAARTVARGFTVAIRVGMAHESTGKG